MEVITEGHLYAMALFEGGHSLIQFIEKEVNEFGKLITVNNGVTNEEVIAVLINRLEYLNGKFPCDENVKAIDYLAGALDILNKRTRDRQARGVEGQAKA